MFRLWLGFLLVVSTSCQASGGRVDSDTQMQQGPAQWVVHEVSPSHAMRLFAFDERAGALRYLKDTRSPFLVYALQGLPLANHHWMLASEDVGSTHIPRPAEWRFVVADSAVVETSKPPVAQWSVSPQVRSTCPSSALDTNGRATAIDRAGSGHAALALSQHWQVWFDDSGALRLGSELCQQIQLPRNYLAQRTAGFYTTGFVVAVDTVMQTTGPRLTVAPGVQNHLLSAAAYQLQARGLLRAQGLDFVPVDAGVWSQVVKRARQSLASYTFRGLTDNPNAELGHLIESDAFEQVLQETPAGDSFGQLQHHGQVWVPLMTLLNHASNAQGKGYVQALTDGSGLARGDASSGAQRAMELLIADGLVYQQGQRWVATRLGLDALPKLARWSGLLASYYGLGDGAQLSQNLAAPQFMAAVDDRHLNVASSGAGLQRFAEEFVLPNLGSIQGLRGIVGVGSGAGGLERMLFSYFRDRNVTIDIFGSDLDEMDSHGNHALEVARAALGDIIPGGRIFPADIRDPEGLFAAVRQQYRNEGLSDAEIEVRMAHMAVTSGFITHEPRSFSAADVTAMLNGYAQHAAHFILLELPLVDAAIHAQQADAHFGVELGTFHLASGQTVRSLSEWLAIIEGSAYRVQAQSEFNKIWNPHTGRYDTPTYVGFHLVRK